MIWRDDEAVPGRSEPPDGGRSGDEGMPDRDEEQAPGTGIFGDETLVKPADGVDRPGISREIPETEGE